MTNNIPVKVENLSKVFRQGSRKVQALNQLSLQVEHGDFVAVMGASGSGKSTLLHLIAGLAEPSGGSVEINGEPLAGKSDTALTQLRRRQIGLVFQAFNLIPTLSAEDNVLLPLKLDGKGNRDAARQALSQVGLDERATHRPDAMSGGEQQRLAIARALISNPAVMLADEPTGNLDSRNSANICRILQNLNENQQRTIIVVTHEPQVAIWAKRIIVLRDGAILTEFPTDQFADAHELAAHYQELLAEN